MKVTDAILALRASAEDIAEEAREKGLSTTLRCRYADIDFDEFDEYTEQAKIIFAELTVSLEGATESMIYECAIGITDGECSDDEMASEVGAMRGAVRELIEKLESAEDKLTAFNTEIKETEGEEPQIDAPVHDNRKFYIAASIGAAVIILLIVLLGKLLG